MGLRVCIHMMFKFLVVVKLKVEARLRLNGLKWSGFRPPFRSGFRLRHLHPLTTNHTGIIMVLLNLNSQIQESPFSSMKN
jgi:hypothetical protein